jgi:hypothetical protein
VVVRPTEGPAVSRRPFLSLLLLAGALALGACTGAGAGQVPTTTTTAPLPDAPPAPSTTTSSTPPRVGPVRVLVVGDSVMVQIGEALRQWSDRNPGRLEVVSKAHIGCGTTRGGLKRYASGTGSNGEVCATWADPVAPALLLNPEVVSWVSDVDVFRPDVVLGYASGWDAIDRKVPQLGDTWYAPGDAPYDEYLRSEYAQALSVLSSTGAAVAWMSTPCTNHPADPAAAPERTARMNAIVAPLVQALPRHVAIDYAGYLGPCGEPRDVEMRADGDHVTLDRLPEVADWLAPQLIAAGAG